MSLEDFIDKVKINWFWESGFTAGGYIVLDSFYDIIKNRGDLDINYSLLSVGLSLIALTPFSIVRNNKNFNRLTEYLNKQYNERVCTPYMNTPCGRTIVKVALDRTKRSDKYPELAKKYKISSL